MPLGQSFVDRRHDLLVAQYLIGVLHPRFVQILDFLGDQPVAKAALRPPRLNHNSASCVSVGRPPDATARG
jgi:hypothetical protein